MDLDTWMKDRHLIDQEVADAVGLSRGYLNNIRRGTVHINLATALALQDYTDGAVGLEELLPTRLQPWAPVAPWKPETARKPSGRKASKLPAAA